MNTREIAAEYRLSHWAGMMRSRQESGLNIRAFCEREGFHENVYYYWQRKLREAACERMSEVEKAESETGLVRTRFTEIQLADASPNDNVSNTLHIEVSGVKITVDSAYPSEKLVQLLKELSKP